MARGVILMIQSLLRARKVGGVRGPPPPARTYMMSHNELFFGALDRFVRTHGEGGREGVSEPMIHPPRGLWRLIGVVASGPIQRIRSRRCVCFAWTYL